MHSILYRALNSHHKVNRSQIQALHPFVRYLHFYIENIEKEHLLYTVTEGDQGRIFIDELESIQPKKANNSVIFHNTLHKMLDNVICRSK